MVHFVISVRPAKHTRRNQVENRHVLITDVRRWNAFRERKGISMNKLVKVISPRKEREVPKYFR